jgi:hypothetical protein
MSEAIFPQQFVAHFDDEGTELIARNPGPAGAVDFELSSGISLLVDFANPNTLSSIRVEGREIPNQLIDLIGEERGEQLDRADRKQRGRRLRLEADRSSDQDSLPRFRGSQSRPPQQFAREIGVMSRLQSLSQDDEVLDVVRGIAALELAQRMQNFGNQAPGLIEVSRRPIELAAALLDGEEADLAFYRDREPKSVTRLARLCQPYQSEFPSLRRAYETLMGRGADISWNIDRHELLQPAASALVASEDFDFEARIRLSAVTLSDGGLLTARVREFEKDWWLRVSLEGSQVLLAVVPVIERGSRAIAEALLPSDLTLSEVELELTQEPLPPTNSTIHQTMDAIRLGRSAVRKSLLARGVTPVSLWLECADLWEQLGDVSRAKQSRRYAEVGLRSVGPRTVTREALSVFESA